MILHAQKRGTKHKTACDQWQGQLPPGEYVTSNPSAVTCPSCKQWLTMRSL